MPDQIILPDPTDPTKIRITKEPVQLSPIDTTLDQLYLELDSLKSRKAINEKQIQQMTLDISKFDAKIAEKQKHIDDAINAGAKKSQ